MDAGKFLSKSTDIQPVSHQYPENEGNEIIQIEESVLYNVLYGAWPEWGGQRPPESVRQKLLRSLPKGSHQNIPKEFFFEVSTLPCEGLGIFAASPVAINTVVGPVRNNSEYSTTDDTAQLNFTNGSDNFQSEINCWTQYIRYARNNQEQNMETILVAGAIYYKTTKDIQAGNEVLVWLGQHSYQHFGLPLDDFTPKKEAISIIKYDDVAEKKRLYCVICQRGFNSRSNLRSHMRTHTMQKPFKCNFCYRKFSQSSTLRNHTRLHTGEKPYKCQSCNSSYSQLAGLKAHQKSSHHSPKNLIQSNN